MTRHEGSEFGVLLQRYRVAAGLTQEVLAERAGISVRGLSDLERGVKTRPHRSTVRQLAEALDLTPVDHAIFVAAARGQQRGPSTTNGSASKALPTAPTAFIGRVGEIAAVADLLGQKRIRLLTLTGAGGSGKTRLAIEAVREVAGSFPDGVAFVPLAPLRDAGGVLPAVAHNLDVKERPGENVSSGLARTLGIRRVLLVLDNFEHVRDAATGIAELLVVCPHLTILATSRIPLRIATEREYPVRPLPVPDPAWLPDRTVLQESDAVRLFVDRARAVQPSFVLTAETAGSIVTICRQVDGLPLGIELAAVRIRIFPPDELAARLGRRLPLLTGGARDVPARQQTLRATIDWSYHLLNDVQQRLFAQLSVFVGGCTLEAAEFVCEGNGGIDVLDGISSLVEHNLVMQEGKEKSRYRMLETIREYGAEQLDVSGGAEGAWSRLAEYVARLAEAVEPRFDEADQAIWHERIDEEIDNIRAGLNWVLAHSDTETALRIAVPLFVFWERRSHLSEGIDWLQQALACDTGSNRHLRARGLRAAGGLRWRRGCMDQMTVSMLEESIRLFREWGHDGDTAGALQNLGLVVLDMEDFSRAEHLLEESLELHRRAGGSNGVAIVLQNLGVLRLRRGETDRARELLQEALEIQQSTGNTWGIAMCLIPLARLLLMESENERAAALARNSIKYFDAMGSAMGIALAGGILGAALAVHRDAAHGVRLLSGSTAVLNAADFPTDYLDHLASVTRPHVEAVIWDTAWREGSWMTAKEIVVQALGEGSPR